MSAELSWPPPYTLKRSRRVRSVRLKICSRKGLQLTLPIRFNINRIPDVLHEHKNWIEKTWIKLQPLVFNLNQESLPNQLELLTLEQTWLVEYQLHDKEHLTLTETIDRKLIISGNIADIKQVLNILQAWLKKQAKKFLLPLLKELSVQTGLNYQKSSIRNATTRWGSCSAKKNISLNFKLLFLPRELVQHVILHELCHTQHLNHSRKFWELLEAKDPNCHYLRKQLKAIQSQLPLWLD